MGLWSSYVTHTKHVPFHFFLRKAASVNSIWIIIFICRSSKVDVIENWLVQLFCHIPLFWKCYASHLLITPKVSSSTRGIWEQQHIHPIRYKEKLLFFLPRMNNLFHYRHNTHTYCTCPLPRTGFETFWNTGVQYTKYISDALYIHCWKSKPEL